LNAAGVKADWAVEAAPPASKAAVEAAPPAAEAAMEAATRMLEAAHLSLVHPHWLTLQLEVRPFFFSDRLLHDYFLFAFQNQLFKGLWSVYG
jgi:hypothetical protein